MKIDVRVGRETVTIEENHFDKAVRYFDPQRAQARFKSRVMGAMAGGYTGASKSRKSLKEWNVSGGDSDADTLPDLPTLRERSSDLIRNSPIATSAVNTAVTNVIGTGLKLQSRIDRSYLKLSDDQADEWEANTEREFRLWAESTDSDASRKVDFYGQQSLAFLSTLEKGDIFYLTKRIKRKNTPYELALQSIEADRVSNKDWISDSPMLGGGVKVDNLGAPTHYHIMKSHPGSIHNPDMEWTEVPAYGSATGRKNVLHLFDVKRPGQKRGIPYLAPVMESIKQIGRYTEAELMAAVISGMFTVFIESEGNGLEDVSGQSADGEIGLGNGLIVDLAPGEKANTSNPGRPNAEFDPFVMAILRQIGAALEIPFELLVKHFTSSYSASKAAFVEAWKFFRMRRAWMVRGFCNPVYELWMDEAVSLGRVSAPGYFNDPMIRKSYLAAMWVGPGKGQIQETQEVSAALARIDGGLSDIAHEAAEMGGRDFEVIHRQRVKEQKMRVEDGLINLAPQEVEPEKEEKGSKKIDKRMKK